MGVATWVAITLTVVIGLDDLGRIAQINGLKPLDASLPVVTSGPGICGVATS